MFVQFVRSSIRVAYPCAVVGTIALSACNGLSRAQSQAALYDVLDIVDPSDTRSDTTELPQEWPDDAGEQ